MRASAESADVGWTTLRPAAPSAVNLHRALGAISSAAETVRSQSRARHNATSPTARTGWPGAAIARRTPSGTSDCASPRRAAASVSMASAARAPTRRHARAQCRSAIVALS
jgi:hypothetical protein